MQRLNRPVILEFSLGNDQKRYVTLVSLDEYRLTLALGPKRYVYPLEQVLAFWRERYILVWKPPIRDMSLLSPGDSSAGVEWVRRQLDKLGMPVPVDAKSAGVYDETLKKRIIAFQTGRGIAPDGLVGPHTMIHLNTAADVANIPKLQGSSGKVVPTPLMEKPGEHSVSGSSDSNS
jgi:general secretion pathway protein A